MQTVKCFDPRDPSQSLDDPKTWRETGNLALIGAHFVRLRGEEVDWKAVAAAAAFLD